MATEPISSIVYIDDLAYWIHTALREEDALKVGNDDNVPYESTGTSRRNMLERVAKRIADEVNIDVETL